jgi:hypothetical protein
MHTRTPAADALADPVGALGAALEPGTDATGRGRAILTGVAAGVAFVAVEILSASLLLGAAPTTTLHNLPAATAVGDGSAGALVVTLAGMLSIVLAAAYGALVAVAARRYSRAAAWWTGAVAGLTVYVINFYYLLAPAHWFGELRDQVSVLSPWYLVTLWP